MTIEELLRKFPLPDLPGRPIRLGIIGLGYIMRTFHLPAIGILKRLGIPMEITAVCDQSGEALAHARPHCPNTLEFTDVTAFMKEADIDALLIAVWPPLAAELVESSLARGWGVLVEKPVSYDFEALTRLEDMIRRQNAQVQVGYNRRWQPLAQVLQQRVANRIPDIVRITLHRSGRNEAKFYRDTMGHPLDFIRSIYGKLEYEASEWKQPLKDRRIPAGAVLHLRTSKGSPVCLDIRPATGRVVETYEFIFPDETWILSYLAVAHHPAKPAYLDVWRSGRQSRFLEIGPFDESDAQLLVRGFVHQMAGLLSMTGGSGPSPVGATLTDARRAMELCERSMHGVAGSL